MVIALPSASHRKSVSALIVAALIYLVPMLTAAQSKQADLDAYDRQQQITVKWQSRVNNLTNEIASESSAVPEGERAVYLALLAKMWWSTDRPRAQRHLNTAIDKILGAIGSKEKDTEISKELKNAEKVLKIVQSFDEKLGRDLVRKIELALSERSNGNASNNLEMAEMFAKLGLQVVDQNPQMAVACGYDSLEYGKSRSLAQLIAKLYAKDAKLGDALFQAASRSARDDYSSDNFSFVGLLAFYAFPPEGSTPLTAIAQRELLTVVSDLISGASAIENERANRCQIAFIAASFVIQFDRFLPTQAPSVRQQIQTCIPYTSTYTQQLTRSEVTGDEPQTVDELVRASSEATDTAVKVRYFHNAISKLEKEKKYAEIISLLDGLSSDDRKAMAYGWNDWRIEYADLAAHEAYSVNDLATAYGVINKTPSELRPYVRIRLVNRLSGHTNREFILENAVAARKELGALDIPAFNAAGSLLVINRLYLAVEPTQSIVVFREAVSFINKADGENEAFDPVKDWAPLADYFKLSSDMYDLDEIALINSLADISSRRSRVRLKLGLLESSLAVYAEARKKLDQLNRKLKQ